MIREGQLARGTQSMRPVDRRQRNATHSIPQFPLARAVVRRCRRVSRHLDSKRQRGELRVRQAGAVSDVQNVLVRLNAAEYAQPVVRWRAEKRRIDAEQVSLCIRDDKRLKICSNRGELALGLEYHGRTFTFDRWRGYLR